jgi:hypothetical protein
VKLKSLIALVALAPSLVLAQANLPSGVSSTGKPSGMPAVPTTPPSQMGKVGDEEQRKPITPSNPVTPTPTNNSGKQTSTGKVESKKSADPTASVGIVSDQRLKRDITPIDLTSNGIQLYSYKYLWSDEVYVGVMAQDLLSNPQWKDAVITSNTGYYKVDYSKLSLQMMTLEQYQLQQQQSNVAVAK